MSDRTPSVSIHATTIAAKEAERQRLAADIAAFQRKRGKRIEVLPTLIERREEPSYRELAHLIVDSGTERKATRRRRSAQPA